MSYSLKSTRRGRSWTPRELRILQEMLDAGRDSAEIADRMAHVSPERSRSAIIGKLHHMRAAARKAALPADEVPPQRDWPRPSAEARRDGHNRLSLYFARNPERPNSGKPALYIPFAPSGYDRQPEGVSLAW